MRHLYGKHKLITELNAIPEEDFPLRVSEKFDGMFALWDGGITRGTPKYKVPWANLNRDTKERGEAPATGLWSKDGNVISAPDWWLDQLPVDHPMLGELWAGYLNQQTVISTCKKKVPGPEWEKIIFKIFQARANLEYIFRPGRIRYSDKHNVYLPQRHPFSPIWKSLYPLRENLIFSYTCQTRDELEALWNALPSGAEGLVCIPEKSLTRYNNGHTNSSPLGYKIKRKFDTEGVVTGWTLGMGRLEGMLGSIILSSHGVQFSLGGGIPDSLRGYDPNGFPTHFPLGTKVTYSYRKLSKDKIPIEARFVRIREVE